MIARRLVAGPSRSLLNRRRLATQAVAAPQAAHANDDEPVLPLLIPTPVVGRLPPPTPRLTTSPEHIKDLLAAASQKPQTPTSRQTTWALFRSLSPAQRAGLSSSYLRTVLSALVPRYDEAWQIVQNSDNRSRLDMNMKLAQRWEKRLKPVMSELVLRKEATLSDWLVVMRALMRVGYVSACESVVNELPPKYRQHVTVLETRLGVIVRWLRNVDVTGCKPSSADVEIAHTAFWEVFRDIQDNQLEVTTFALRLLLQASSELSSLILELQREDSVARFDEVLRYVFLNGYGMDLDNLPVSVEQRALDKSREFPLLSASALNATLAQLRRRGTDTRQLLAIFDLLTSHTKVASNVGSARAFEEEEDEEFIPTLSSQTAAEEASGERRNWLGMKVNRSADFFEASTSSPHSSSASSTPAAAPQGEAHNPTDSWSRYHIRRVRDYLPQHPAPSTIAPQTTLVLPTKHTWDSETFLILLRAAAQGSARLPDPSQTDVHLMTAILEIGVQEVLASNTEWISAYLACPENLRPSLYRPQRISPEWFRYVLARQSSRYGRASRRTQNLLAEAIQWNQQMIDTITAHEARLAQIPLPADAGHVHVPRPSYLGSAQRIRKWRNAGIFIVPDELEALYLDQTKLQHCLERAETISRKRRSRRHSRTTHGPS